MKLLENIFINCISILNSKFSKDPNMKKTWFYIAAISLLWSSCKQNTHDFMIQYPITKEVDTVDYYFGEAVADPYRWLEDDRSEETAAWVQAQNEITFNYLGKIPYRENVKKRIESIFNYERLGAPFREGNYEYFYKNDGLQNHSVLYRRPIDSVSNDAEIFLDPNSFSEDGTTSLSGIYFSKDGSLATYLISEGGSDWRKAITIQTSDKAPIGDTLVDLKFTGIAWRNNEGFYYSSYDKPSGSELSAKTQHHKLYFHTLGTPQKNDILVFGGEKTPRRYVGAGITEDQRFLIITASNSTSGNELYLQDLYNPKSVLQLIVSSMDNDFNVVAQEGSKFIIHTNFKAPNYRLIEVDYNRPASDQWIDIVAENDMAIESVSAAGKNIFINYLRDASTLIRQVDYTGKQIREIKLPGIGTAGGFSGKETDSMVYYAFSSFTIPSSIYAFTIADGTSELYKKPTVAFDPDAFETKQVFYTSKDGTKVPMFIVYKKGLKLDGKNPTLLYGYGGFNVSLTPAFSAARIVWLENGGVFAQPSLRGGGEYGERWHLAGTKMNKQNVFDDFIAAAHYLINEKYTSTDYLALSGGSNGGLLVGAVMTQQPQLAKVALPAVGVLDMLRYHTFTAGAGWDYDYGTAQDSPAMFAYLKNYSPLHALKPNTAYPATLITTADHDDRVVPAHSFKFAAALQKNHIGNNPVLIRIDTNSGHGSSNLSKSIEYVTDQYVFTWFNMKFTPPALP
jgi:prolyl oligopeptidase